MYYSTELYLSFFLSFFLSLKSYFSIFNLNLYFQFHIMYNNHAINNWRLDEVKRKCHKSKSVPNLHPILWGWKPIYDNTRHMLVKNEF